MPLSRILLNYLLLHSLTEIEGNALMLPLRHRLALNYCHNRVLLGFGSRALLFRVFTH